MYDNVTRAMATSSDHRAVRRAWPALPDTMPIPAQGGEHWCPTKQSNNTKFNIHIIDPIHPTYTTQLGLNCVTRANSVSWFS